MSDAFGLPLKTSAGGAGDPFAIIITYDAKAGRAFRIDRGPDSSGNYVSTKTDITGLDGRSPPLKCIVDFENIETGWMLFTPGQAPSIVLVEMGQVLPPPPTKDHKVGVRFMLKLSNDCAGGAPPIREITGTAAVFRQGFGEVYNQYKAERGAHPGMLPVIVLAGTLPVTTGQGLRQSTNYQPQFRIIGWAPRGDLVFIKKAPAVQQSQFAQPYPQGQQPLAGAFTNGAAPATGAQPVAPPQQAAHTVSANDFG